MRVIAKIQGFYGGSRRRVGAEFEMSEDAMHKDAQGNPILPKWVVPASPENRANIERIRSGEDERFLRGAIAASGEGVVGKKRFGAKADSLGEASRRSTVGQPLKVSGPSEGDA